MAAGAARQQTGARYGVLALTPAFGNWVNPSESLGST